MSVLGTLKFVAAKRPTQLSPMQARRNKLSNKIWEQIQLANAMANGSTYRPKRIKNVRDEATGETKTVEVPKRIKQWWWTADNGRVCLSIRYGAKVLELAKGKAACEVGSGAELVAALETIKVACEQGELDAQIEAASGALKSGFKK